MLLRCNGVKLQIVCLSCGLCIKLAIELNSVFILSAYHLNIPLSLKQESKCSMNECPYAKYRSSSLIWVFILRKGSVSGYSL